MKFVFTIFALFIFQIAVAQPLNYTVAQAHSHNDYLQAEPFTAALNAGFGSVEADIFPVNGILLVAHSSKELDPAKSLNALYLQPLQRILESSSVPEHGEIRKDIHQKKSNNPELQLLIDIKTDTRTCMNLLKQQLIPLKKYLSTPDHLRRIKIVITGEIPLPQDFADYPEYFFYDHNLSRPLTGQQWKRVGMVSVNFKTYSKWKGKGPIAEADLDSLRSLIDQAHQRRKRFRFWGMPDQPDSWTLQKGLGVDWIGTDCVGQLKAFLAAQKP